MHVGEARKISWSLGERILRDGVRYVQEVSDEVVDEDDAAVAGGGGGKEGVSGMGVGLSWPCLRRRGSSLGIRSLRFGMEDGVVPGRRCGACCEDIPRYLFFSGRLIM